MPLLIGACSVLGASTSVAQARSAPPDEAPDTPLDEALDEALDETPDEALDEAPDEAPDASPYKPVRTAIANDEYIGDGATWGDENPEGLDEAALDERRLLRLDADNCPSSEFTENGHFDEEARDACVVKWRACLADEDCMARGGFDAGDDTLAFISGRIDLGPVFRPRQTPRPSVSLFVDLGVSVLIATGRDSPVAPMVRPALGYRLDGIRGLRHLGELGVEVGFVHANSRLGLSYRPALVLGSTPITAGERALALGIRHGPTFSYGLGMISLTFSHEYLGLPEAEHGFRVGLAIELSALALTLWSFAL